MIFNKGNLNISNDNPKTYTIIEKNGEYHVCKMLGTFESFEEALELQTKVTIGMVSEEKASKEFFIKTQGNDVK